MWKRDGGGPRQIEVTLRPDPETQLCLPSADLGPTAMACPSLVRSYVGPWLDLAHPCALPQARWLPKAWTVLNPRGDVTTDNRSRGLAVSSCCPTGRPKLL